MSCTNKKSSSLDKAKKDAITNEIETTLNSIHNAWKIRDLTSAFSYFPDTLDFNYVGADGTLMNHQDFIKMCNEIFDNNQVEKLELLETKIKILNSDLVVAYTFYKWELTNLNSSYIYKIGSTFIFKKIDERWIVTHIHESFSEPEVITKENNTHLH